MGASNSWAIHGNYTKNGKPIICNDPHLGNGIPSVWHVATLEIYGEGSKNIKIWGAYNLGLPVPSIGSNNKLTFTITVHAADTSDLYEEKINGDSYLFKDKWLPLKKREEVIKIKG